MINKIIERKRRDIKELKACMPLDKLKDKIRAVSRGNLFHDALKKRDKISIIAELKKASPSKGLLMPGFKLLEAARLYEEGGVEAISVLTEKNFFKGELDYVRLLRQSVKLPILQKDFFIDEYQIYYAAYLGSDAILLIARVLSKEEISAFMTLAKSLNIAVLAEVHDEADIKKV
ncbi:MAG: indole-3-glycerol-phosphate synthase, partial [Candidatus Omnitrophica bacterium]|nr:indole-3-glycerol-phosphate synthase [Candidatus Omnitrophota bacterium]